MKLNYKQTIKVVPECKAFWPIYGLLLFCLSYISNDLHAQIDPNCTNNTGSIFFEQCGNQGLYFFIETTDGQIFDPYYADGVVFDHYEGQSVNFDYEVADFATPCAVAEQAIFITCIEEAPQPPMPSCDANTGTIHFERCGFTGSGPLIFLIHLEDGTKYEAIYADGVNFGHYGGQIVNFDYNFINNTPTCVYDFIEITCIEDVSPLPSNCDDCSYSQFYPGPFYDVAGNTYSNLCSARCAETDGFYNEIITICEGETLDLYPINEPIQNIASNCGPVGPPPPLNNQQVYWNVASENCNSNYCATWTGTPTDSLVLVATATRTGMNCPAPGEPQGPQGLYGPVYTYSSYLILVESCTEPPVNCGCSDEYDPVYDINGQEYQNECIAECEGITETYQNLVTACIGDTVNITIDFSPTPPPDCPGAVTGTSNISWSVPNCSDCTSLELLTDSSGPTTISATVNTIIYCNDGSSYTQTTVLTYLVLVEECTTPPPTENNPIFEEYTWLSSIVNPNNCNGETIYVYNEGTYSFVYIDSPSGGTLYFQDGSIYCSDSPGFSCVNAYNLGSADLEWSCENNGNGSTCSIEDLLNVINIPPPSSFQCTYTGQITQFTYNNETYFRLHAYPNLETENPCPVQEFFGSIVNCAGEQICIIALVGSPPGCDGDISAASSNGTIVWTYEPPNNNNNPIFTDYPWLSSIVNPNSCDDGTSVTVYNAGSYNFVSVTYADGSSLLYYQDGTLYCTDFPGFSCVNAYGLNNVAATWTCGDTGGNPNPSNDQIFTDYPWLSSIVNPSNCNDETASVYSAGSYNFIYVNGPDGGELYYQDGTFYCADAPGFSCLNVYGLSTLVDTWACGDNGGGNEQVDFPEYPWLNTLVDANDCANNLSVITYFSGAYTYIYISTADGLGTLYFQDGTLYCTDSPAFSCINAYGLSTVPATILWSCSMGRPDGDIVEEATPEEETAYRLDTKDSILDFTIYPNPSNGLFNVKINSKIEQEQLINIFDLQGRLLETFNLTPNAYDSNIQVDLSTYENGLYMVELRSNFQSKMERVMIQR